MDLNEIQHAIEELPEDQQVTLAAWLDRRTALIWDRQIEQDFSPGGEGMELLSRVKEQVQAGLSRPLSEGEPHS